MTNIRYNRWLPTTCDCALIYEFDDDLPDNQIEEKFLFAQRICGKHKHLSANHLKVWEAVRQESRQYIEKQGMLNA